MQQLKDVEQAYLDLVEKTRLENEQIKADNRKQLEEIEQEYRDLNVEKGKIYVDITIPEWEKQCQDIDMENATKSKESSDRKKYVQSYNERGEHINSHNVKIFVVSEDLINKLNKVLVKTNISYVLFTEKEFLPLADFVVNSESDFKQIELFLNPDSVMVYVADTEQKDFVKKEKYRYISLLNEGVSYTLLDINILSKTLEKAKFTPLSHTPYKPLVHPPKPVYVKPDKRKAQLKELINDPMIQTPEYVGIMKNGKLTKVNTNNKWNINKL